ncbi:hypothetical protein DSO57_1031875 [Entomophthora muscae]|uniref:Uncharacterized protein n=1 Tax=Entomophthora muscae TaxID=34485 RepID=A0ACC2S2G3_9FUNG|nr:hypothetical protein DSO57_1031875 [Entomophthora muscae]
MLNLSLEWGPTRQWLEYLYIQTLDTGRAGLNKDIIYPKQFQEGLGMLLLFTYVIELDPLASPCIQLEIDRVDVWKTDERSFMIRVGEMVHGVGDILVSW